MASVTSRLDDMEDWRRLLDRGGRRPLPDRVDDLEAIVAEFRGLTRTLKAFAAVVSTAVGMLTLILLVRGLL